MVLSGMLAKGTIVFGQDLKLGPDVEGEFKSMKVKNIQCKRVAT
jgi:GTPase